MKKALSLIFVIFCVSFAFVGCDGGILGSTTNNTDRFSYWKGGIANHIFAEYSVVEGEFSVTVNAIYEGFPFMVFEYDPITRKPLHVRFGFSSASFSSTCECPTYPVACELYDAQTLMIEIPEDPALVEVYSKLGISGPVWVMADCDVTTNDTLTDGGMEFWASTVIGTFHFKYTTQTMVGELGETDYLGVMFSAPSKSIQLLWQFSDSAFIEP